MGLASPLLIDSKVEELRIFGRTAAKCICNFVFFSISGKAFCFFFLGGVCGG